MSRFIDNAISKINNSLTKEEAKASFEKSCSMCYKAGLCNEEICPISKAFQNRIVVLESYERASSGLSAFVETREYHISSQQLKKRHSLILLTKFSKKAKEQGLREAILTIDEASVAMELDDVERMLDILAKYPKIFQKIKAIWEEE